MMSPGELREAYSITSAISVLSGSSIEAIFSNVDVNGPIPAQSIIADPLLHEYKQMKYNINALAYVRYYLQSQEYLQAVLDSGQHVIRDIVQLVQTFASRDRIQEYQEAAVRLEKNVRAFKWKRNMMELPSFLIAGINAAVALARVANEPTLGNLAGLMLNLANLYSMYAGFNPYAYVSLVFNSGIHLANGEYLAILLDVLSAFSFMLLPVLLVEEVLDMMQWFGYSFFTSALHAPSTVENILSLYSSWGNKESQLKSAAAWASLMKPIVGLHLPFISGFAEDVKQYNLKKIVDILAEEALQRNLSAFNASMPINSIDHDKCDIHEQPALLGIAQQYKEIISADLV